MITYDNEVVVEGKKFGNFLLHYNICTIKGKDYVFSWKCSIIFISEFEWFIKR